MKILMITSTYIPHIGGIEYHIKGLMKSLPREQNTKVDIVEVNVKYKYIKIEHNKDSLIYKIPAKGVFPFLFFKKLTDIIQNFDYDVIHVHDPQVAGITLHFLLNNYKIPLVLSTHGGMFHTSKGIYKKIYWKLITKNIIKIYDKTICVSHTDFDIFKKIVRKDKISLIECGIDCDKFNTSSRTRNYKDISFIYFGRLSQNKQIHLLVDIFNKLSSCTEGVKLLIIGDTNDMTYKKSLEEKSRNNPDITMIGFVEDGILLEKVSASDFFITTSNYEGFGMSVIESMSGGLIPIVNDISPLNKLVKNDVDGFVIDFSDKEQALTKLKKIVKLDSEKLQTISDNALKKAYTFSWQVKSREHIDIYDKILNTNN